MYTIVAASQKGGSGKTTLSGHLAVEASRAGQGEIALIDTDPQGSLGINLGVYGAPETFLIDAQGIIRHKYVGAIDERVWREELAPRYQALLESKPGSAC